MLATRYCLVGSRTASTKKYVHPMAAVPTERPSILSSRLKAHVMPTTHSSETGAPRQRRGHQSAAEGDHEDDQVEAHFTRPLCRSVAEIVCSVCVKGDDVRPSVGE